MAICLPGIASRTKRAPTSATRSEPLAMTTNWMIVRIEEDDGADDVVAPHHEVAEGADHLPGVGLEQDEARRRDVEREAEERRQEEQRRERGDGDGVGHVEDDQEDADGDARLAAMRTSSIHVGSGTIIKVTARITRRASTTSATRKERPRRAHADSMAPRFAPLAGAPASCAPREKAERPWADGSAMGGEG